MSSIGESFDQFYRRWSIWMAIANLIGFLSALFLKMHDYWAIAVLFLFILYVVSIPKFTPPSRVLFGLANWVTILRILITVALFSIHQHLSDMVLFFGFLIAIGLDGLDGYLARKLDQSSPVGGNLDMEADSFLVFALSWIHFDQTRVGWWILVPGGLKYAYTIMFFWSRKSTEFLPKVARATIAVTFFISLCLAFILPKAISFYLLVLSSALICFSFASSMYFALRTRFST